MINFLKGQTDDECFETALPDKIVADKTGALIDIFADGGIIYGNNEDVILVIIAENFTGASTVINRMKKFAQYVVLYLNLNLIDKHRKIC